MNQLLLIIDVQKYFIPKGRKGEAFCQAIEKLQKNYKTVAVSQFINSPDSFWVRYLDWNKMMPAGKEVELAFEPVKNAFIYENSTFTSVNKKFLDYLHKNEIEEVHICGIDTDACILATAYDLWDRKIPFCVLIDHCISSAGDNTHSSAQVLMNKNFGFKIVKTA